MAGGSYRQIGERFDVSPDAVFRHMDNHVPDDLRAQYIAEVPLREVAERAAKEGLSLLEYLALVRSILVQEFQLAAQVHDRSGTAAISGRLLETVRQMSQLTGELARMNPALNITNNTAVFVQSPAFTQLHEMLIRKLVDYPDALAAVLEGLGELEANETAQGVPGLPAAICEAVEGIPNARAA